MPYTSEQRKAFRSQYPEKKQTLEEINRQRVAQGLYRITQGMRKCLACDKTFFSEDLRLLKQCDHCRDLYCGIKKTTHGDAG